MSEWQGQAESGEREPEQPDQPTVSKSPSRQAGPRGHLGSGMEEGLLLA